MKCFVKKLQSSYQYIAKISTLICRFSSREMNDIDTFKVEYKASVAQINTLNIINFQILIHQIITRMKDII